jgi:tRNA A-37 threonylcarbamoyl transferase component Bud32
VTLADRSGLPDGFKSCAIGGTLVVARTDQHDAICAALGMGTLHAWASTQPSAEAMRGRGVAWATRLPDGTPVVVRHSQHGGMLAPLTRDLFLTPTRAPAELAISERLRAAGIRTPAVVAYAVYSAFGPLCRADVVTERVVGLDLPAALNAWSSQQERHGIRVAVSRMMELLWLKGVRHPDLNAKNILLSRDGDSYHAWVIDVDRVEFRAPSDEHPQAMLANSMRLARSLRKLQHESGVQFTMNEIQSISNFSPPSARAVLREPE